MLGQVCARLRKYEEAIEHYRAGLNLAPDYVAGRTDLTAVLMELGRDAEAADEFARAEQLAPNDPAVVELRKRLAAARPR